jgi:hypothetical protein
MKATGKSYKQMPIDILNSLEMWVIYRSCKVNYKTDRNKNLSWLSSVHLLFIYFIPTDEPYVTLRNTNNMLCTFILQRIWLFTYVLHWLFKWLVCPKECFRLTHLYLNKRAMISLISFTWLKCCLLIFTAK